MTTYYRPGLSNKTKELMKERDQTRKSIPHADINDKPGLKAKYRQLRNRAINQMMADTLERNSVRISEEKNEIETWKDESCFILALIKERKRLQKFSMENV